MRNEMLKKSDRAGMDLISNFNFQISDRHDLLCAIFPYAHAA